MLSDSEWLAQTLALGGIGQVIAQALCSSENVEGSLGRPSPCSEFGVLPVTSSRRGSDPGRLPPPALPT